MTGNSMWRKANSALISYPRYERLKHFIELSHRMSLEANEPQCMFLEGYTGTGKTTLVRDYARAYPRVETPTGSEVPVFYMETPSPVTPKGMSAAMLARLGDPASGRGSQQALSDRITAYLARCKVQLVILDDFHHLIDGETNRVLERVSDWLKVLIKESLVPFLVVGTEGKVERVLTSNAQLSRLFAYRVTLDPFAWNERDTDTLKDFATFISFAERAIGTSLGDEVARAEMLHRVHYATDGVVANMMNLLRHAAFIASEKKTTTLDLVTLTEAFDTRLSKHLRYKENPFEARWGKTFVAPEAKFFDPPEGTGNRIRRRKTPQPTASEVLKKK